MEFRTFSVAGTNIFPQSNSKHGGQLVTEFNLRSRESVGTPANLKFMVGPSYAHSMDDFEVRIHKDAAGIVISPSTIEVTPGRAVVNGHYIETLFPMLIDLVEANEIQKREGKPQLLGELAIGIRIMYSTELTMSGSMLVEDENNMYQGVQLVVLPASEMKTPFDSNIDSTTTEQNINAHLRLATFSFYDGTIQGEPKVNPDKCKCIGAERISEIDKLLGDTYLRKTNLNARKLYVFSGKEIDPKTGRDTWCDATNSLMVWDEGPLANDSKITSVPPASSARFERSIDGNSVELVVPHMQVDGMTDDKGNPAYFRSVSLKLPIADYGSNSAGTVDKKYTQNIKNMASKLSQIHQLVNGKQVAFLESKDKDTQLPKINPRWKIGDYTLVKYDYDADESADGATPPSTIYVVLPGYVRSTQYCKLYIEYIKTVTKFTDKSKPTLSEAEYIIHDTSETSRADITFNEIEDEYHDKYYVEKNNEDSDRHSSLFECYDRFSELAGVNIDTISASDKSSIDVTTGKIDAEYPVFYTDEDEIRGSADPSQTDYFTVKQIVIDTEKTEDSEITTTHEYQFFYKVTASGPRAWSNFIPITGETPFAQESVIGGFLNVPETATDAGYVYRDEDGYLRLLDYSLLRSGTLAYQLGKDESTASGIVTEDIQDWLDDRINQRVAFPSISQIQNKEKPNIINIYIDLSAEEEQKDIVIRDIDARFNTCVYFHFSGSANNNTTINIVNCQRIRIDTNLPENRPKINIYRSCLYYDASVINYIRSSHVNDTFTGMQDISLWYERFDNNDPDLLVNDMTVTGLDARVMGREVDFWNPLSPDDNHYHYALKGITFSGSGNIVGCDLLVANDSTNNLKPGHKIIVGEFILPQSNDLVYPNSCLTKPIKITGTFVSAYKDTATSDWLVTDTSFTATTGTYSPLDSENSIKGTIAFHANTNQIEAEVGDTIPGWDPASYHIFSGGVIG